MHTAKLIAATQPRISDVKTAGDFIAYCARVSNPGNQHNNETANKLLEYMIENAHWSPFEMVSLVFEINTTRDIGRQILRHRSFSFQEFSGRYAVMPDVFAFRELRMQDKKNRQNSISHSDPELRRDWHNTQQNVYDYARVAYEYALSNGIAKEQARALLPEGLTTSTMYMSGTLRSFIHYCMVRCDNSTQKEHRSVALHIIRELQVEFPMLKAYLDKFIQ